ncbi:hypothetical protein FP828_03715 [bacterium]|nr:hypothetical protein [Candidatus Omnitrophota bacterium]MBA3065580.1 hypothetical protein [bacterium]
MKKTKDDLVREKEADRAEIVQLKEMILTTAERDLRFRKEFSKVLDGYMERVEYGMMSTRIPEPLNWEGIFFRVGELHSDAGKNKLIKTNNALREKLAEAERELDEINRNRTQEVIRR